MSESALLLLLLLLLVFSSRFRSFAFHFLKNGVKGCLFFVLLLFLIGVLSYFISLLI